MLEGSSPVVRVLRQVGSTALFLAACSPAIAGATIVYNSIPGPLPPNYPSLGYQATSTAEFGDLSQMTTPGGTLTRVTVGMSDWAPAADYPSLPASSGPTWNHPLTMNLYAVDNSGPNPAPGALIATRTQTFAIPWRPVTDPTCPGGTAWRAGDGNCYGGVAFTVVFDFTGTVVPSQIIYGLAFNTQTSGANPIGVPGPYNALNFGFSSSAATVGINPFPDTAYWNTTVAGNYTDGGSGGVGIFRRDTGWTPFSGAVTFEVASAIEVPTLSASALVLLALGLALAAALKLRARSGSTV